MADSLDSSSSKDGSCSDESDDSDPCALTGKDSSGQDNLVVMVCVDDLADKCFGRIQLAGYFSPKFLPFPKLAA